MLAHAGDHAVSLAQTAQLSRCGQNATARRKRSYWTRAHVPPTKPCSAIIGPTLSAEEARFLVDNNLGTQLAAGMKGFGEDVVHLTEHLNPNAPDTDVLALVGSNGWCLITRDNRIRYRPAESGALKEHQVGAFFMSGKNLGRCQIIQQLVRNWPRMKKLAGATQRPFAFRVPPNGKNIKRLS